MQIFPSPKATLSAILELESRIRAPSEFTPCQLQQLLGTARWMESDLEVAKAPQHRYRYSSSRASTGTNDSGEGIKALQTMLRHAQ